MRHLADQPVHNGAVFVLLVIQYARFIIIASNIRIGIDFNPVQIALARLRLSKGECGDGLHSLVRLSEVYP